MASIVKTFKYIFLQMDVMQQQQQTYLLYMVYSQLNMCILQNCI